MKGTWRWRGRLAAVALGAALAFAGCSDDDDGGGGGPIGNGPPAVSAGANQQLTAGDAARLAASVTDPNGDAITHAWTLVSKPAGSAAALAPDAALDASFQTDVEGAYVLRLTGSDGKVEQTAEVTLTAAPRYTGGATGTPGAQGEDLAAIAARVDAVLALGYNTINPDALMKRLSGKDKKADGTPIPADSILVVDVRKAEDFAKGHIPGAVNVPLPQVPAALLGNPAFFGTKEIAVASYNGGDGNMASLLINLARIPVAADLKATPHPASRALFGGMTSWSFDRELSPTRFDDDKDVRRVEDGAIETAANAGADQKFPTYAAFSATADDVTRKILVRAREYLAALDAEGAWWTDFVKYRAIAADAQPENDPQVLSVRAPADYAKGHVPGAVNIVWQQVAKLDRAKIVDPGRKVFVYCYTGHTGGVATMALGILGYQTRNLLYGLNGWTLSSGCGSGQLRRYDVAKAWDFPLHDSGDGVATLDGYVPPATGCVGCHANLTALYSAYSYTEPPAPGVVSEGEG